MTGIYRQERGKINLQTAMSYIFIGGNDMGVHIGKKNPLSCVLKVHLVYYTYAFQFIQSLSHVQLFATPWTAARQASLFITNSRSLLKLMSIELVMPSNHLILCHPLLLLPDLNIPNSKPKHVSCSHHLWIISRCLEAAYYSNLELSNNGTAI